MYNNHKQMCRAGLYHIIYPSVVWVYRSPIQSHWIRATCYRKIDDDLTVDGV